MERSLEGLFLLLLLFSYAWLGLEGLIWTMTKDREKDVRVFFTFSPSQTISRKTCIILIDALKIIVQNLKIYSKSRFLEIIFPEN